MPDDRLRYADTLTSSRMRAGLLLLSGGAFVAVALGSLAMGGSLGGKAVLVALLGLVQLWTGVPLALDLHGGPVSLEGVVMDIRRPSALQQRYGLVAELSVPASGEAARRTIQVPPALAGVLRVGDRVRVRTLPRSGVVVELARAE